MIHQFVKLSTLSSQNLFQTRHLLCLIPPTESLTDEFHSHAVKEGRKLHREKKKSKKIKKKAEKEAIEEVAEVKEYL